MDQVLTLCDQCYTKILESDVFCWKCGIQQPVVFQDTTIEKEVLLATGMYESKAVYYLVKSLMGPTSPAGPLIILNTVFFILIVFVVFL